MTKYQRMKLVVKEMDEVARLAMFGHGSNCAGVSHGKKDDEYDLSCNLCKALDALRTRRQEAGV